MLELQGAEARSLLDFLLSLFTRLAVYDYLAQDGAVRHHSSHCAQNNAHWGFFLYAGEHSRNGTSKIHGSCQEAKLPRTLGSEIFPYLWNSGTEEYCMLACI